MKAVRIALGVVGGLLISYGVVRLVHGLPGPMLALLSGWVLAVLLIQFVILAPLVLSVGAALRPLPDRGRAFIQAALIISGLVTIIAIPLMLRQFTQPPAKAMLLQDYRLNLLFLVVVIAAGTSIAYAVRVARDRR